MQQPKPQGLLKLRAPWRDHAGLLCKCFLREAAAAAVQAITDGWLLGRPPTCFFSVLLFFVFQHLHAHQLPPQKGVVA